MNGTSADLAEVETLLQNLGGVQTDVLICPPATLLHRMSEMASDSILATGGQTCDAKLSGAHTGDLSAEMLKDAGATYVILGHSERRDDHGETSEDIREKARAALASDLTAVVCLGESEAQRDAENTLDIIGGQLAGSIPDDVTADRLVVAYEPIWAIGTGRVPTLEQISEVHDFIRARLIRRFGETTGAQISILYGGSVKPTNASDIFAVPNVDGALVGGASLKAADFIQIINALDAA